jgi:hypothetical protein
MNANLVHQYEMLQRPFASVAAGAWTVLSSLTYFDPSWFDGATYYFEITYHNHHATNDYHVHLVDHSNADAELTYVNCTANTTANETRVRSASFTPATGKHKYAIQFVQTAVDSQIEVFDARIVIVQAAATKTRLQFPIYSEAAEATAAITEQARGSRNYTSYAVSAETSMQLIHKHGQHATLNGSTPWTFEAVLAASEAATIGYAQLRNFTDTTYVTASEVSVTGVTPDVVDVSISDTATNFEDGTGHDFDCAIKSSSATYYCYAYKANLYVSISPIVSGEVWLRNAHNLVQTQAHYCQRGRSKVDTNSYSNPVMYFEASGYCDQDIEGIVLYTTGTNDAGIGSATSIVGLNFGTGTTRKLMRSSQITNITDGYRIIGYKPATTPAAFTHGRLIVAFTSGPTIQASQVSTDIQVSWTE